MSKKKSKKMHIKRYKYCSETKIVLFLDSPLTVMDGEIVPLYTQLFWTRISKKKYNSAKKISN